MRPLVEMTVRILLRSTLAARTSTTSLRMETKAASKITASKIPALNVSQRLRAKNDAELESADAMPGMYKQQSTTRPLLWPMQSARSLRLLDAAQGYGGPRQSRVFLPAVRPGYNVAMPKQARYTPEHAAAGLDAKFPEIETWPNQFPGYEILIDDPEFTSVCPKTGLPDFGVITIRYMPDKHCLELKSYKEYLHTYRNLGIFQENIVNQILEDVVRWAKPVWAEVKGDFRPRGGISTTVLASWPRPKSVKSR